MPQTKRQIEALLTQAGIRPLRQYGQNFLIDGNLMLKLVAAAGVTARDVVLEVGPGTGSLTEQLLAAAGHVVSVEIDKGLHALCRDRFADSANFTLIHTDILERKSEPSAMVIETLRARQQGLGGRTMLVANLPYQVATPLIVELLLGELLVSPMCFTVQAEVADRIIAPAGGRDYGPVSIIVQALAAVERIGRVPPEAFWPMPKVDSAMLRVDRQETDASAPDVRRSLVRIVHGCFLHRRKTLRWNLRATLGETVFRQTEADGRWNLEDRPERLTVRQWVDMARLLSGADERR